METIVMGPYVPSLPARAPSRASFSERHAWLMLDADDASSADKQAVDPVGLFASPYSSQADPVGIGGTALLPVLDQQRGIIVGATSS
jgi:hypothetical protein